VGVSAIVGETTEKDATRNIPQKKIDGDQRNEQKRQRRR
jgi:hypothetical protein